MRSTLRRQGENDHRSSRSHLGRNGRASADPVVRVAGRQRISLVPPLDPRDHALSKATNRQSEIGPLRSLTTGARRNAPCIRPAFDRDRRPKDAVTPGYMRSIKQPTSTPTIDGKIAVTPTVRGAEKSASLYRFHSLGTSRVIVKRFCFRLPSSLGPDAAR